MGAAAYNRGSKVISAAIARDFDVDKKYLQKQMQKMHDESQEFNEYATKAMCFIVDPKGLARGTVEHQKQKTKFKRLLSCCSEAHIDWINTDNRNIIEYFRSCKARAKAYHDTLKYVMCDWNIKYYIGKIPAHLD